MGFACKLGIHKWNGCKCVRCGERRDEGHDWQLVVLDVLKPTVFGQAHRKQCRMQCSICGLTKYTEHDWDGCKCTRCDEVRDFNQYHTWERFVPLLETDSRYRTHHRVRCSKCGKSKSYLPSHSFEQIAGGLQRCTECGVEIKARPNLRTPEAESNYFAKLIASREVGYYDEDLESKGRGRVNYGDHVTTVSALTSLFIALADNDGADNAAPKSIARKLNEIASKRPDKAGAVGAAFAQIACDESVHIFWRSWVVEHDWIKDENRAAEARASVEKWREEHPRSQADIDYENAMIASDSGLYRTG